MAQVEKQILAAQKFLTGLHGLESIQGLRQKQADRIVNVIQGQKLSLEDAGKALDSVRSEIWGEELATVLKEAVAKQMDDSREPKSRMRLQDYKTLVHYLDRKHWEFLQQADFSRDTAVTNVCHLAVHLGLRHPTEGTFGAILAIVFCHDKAKPVSEQEKFYFLQQYKPQMRKIFQTAPVASEFAEVLPVDVANFPHALLNTAYPHGFEPFTPAHVDLMALKSLTDTYPLRKDNLKARSNEQSLQPVCPQLSAEIQCLQGLYKVILAWLKAKRCRDASEEVVLKFAESQGQHLRLFVATYGWEAVRPKMHYSLHLPAQIRRKGFVLDAFATERKHRYFKNTVANSVRRLHDFASVAMLKLTEYDMNTALPAEKMRTRLVGRVTLMGCELASGLC